MHRKFEFYKCDFKKDFGPIVQARKELEEMSEMRRHTNQLLQNILPLHVAKYFLEQDRQFHELYAQGKPNIIYFHYNIFSNFSCVFLNPNNFFQFEFELF